MNIIKLFALATICFSATSINAMHHQTNIPVEAIDIDRLNLSYEEESYFKDLKNLAQPGVATLSFIPDIPFHNYIPSNIEGLSEKMAFYFNVITTLELFKHAMNNANEETILKKILSVDVHNVPKNELSTFYDKCLLLSAYSEIVDLKLTHIERNKICKMVRRNIDKIIENLLNIV